MLSKINPTPFLTALVTPPVRYISTIASVSATAQQILEKPKTIEVGIEIMKMQIRRLFQISVTESDSLESIKAKTFDAYWKYLGSTVELHGSSNNLFFYDQDWKLVTSQEDLWKRALRGEDFFCQVHHD